MPCPVSITETRAYSPRTKGMPMSCRPSCSSSLRDSVSSRSVPPPGMASRALNARLMITWSSCARPAPHQQVAESEDDGHHVVDFVGYAAGQPACSLQALGATKPLLCPLELSEILNGDHVGAATRTWSERGHIGQHRKQRAIGPEVKRLVHWGIRLTPPPRWFAGPVGRKQIGEQSSAQAARVRVAVQRRECGVHRLYPLILGIHNGGTPACPVEHPDPLLQGVFQTVTASLLITQRVIQLRALNR